MKTSEEFTRNHNVKTSTERQFGFFWFFVLFAFFLFSLFRNGEFSPTLFFMTFITLAISILKPVLFKPINKAWIKLGFIMAHITNPVVLGFFFFLILTPFSFFFRLLSGNSLIKNQEKVLSTWVKCDENPNTSMENQF